MAEDIAESLDRRALTATSGTNRAVQVLVEGNRELLEETIALGRAEAQTDDPWGRGGWQLLGEADPSVAELQRLGDAVEVRSRDLDVSKGDSLHAKDSTLWKSDCATQPIVWVRPSPVSIIA